MIRHRGRLSSSSERQRARVDPDEHAIGARGDLATRADGADGEDLAPLGAVDPALQLEVGRDRRRSFEADAQRAGEGQICSASGNCSERC